MRRYAAFEEMNWIWKLPCPISLKSGQACPKTIYTGKELCNTRYGCDTAADISTSIMRKSRWRRQGSG